jgi:acetyl-CoA carboxylase alpha subunit
MADAVVPEPRGGAGANPAALMRALRPVLRRALTEVRALDTETLLARRYEKYRKY